ncbi:hypothetical protein ACHAPJ_006991 [Fusarium lateritium]
MEHDLGPGKITSNQFGAQLTFSSLGHAAFKCASEPEPRREDFAMTCNKLVVSLHSCAFEYYGKSVCCPPQPRNVQRLGMARRSTCANHPIVIPSLGNVNSSRGCPRALLHRGANNAIQGRAPWRASPPCLSLLAGVAGCGKTDMIEFTSI